MEYFVCLIFAVVGYQQTVFIAKNFPIHSMCTLYMYLYTYVWYATHYHYSNQTWNSLDLGKGITYFAEACEDVTFYMYVAKLQPSPASRVFHVWFEEW